MEIKTINPSTGKIIQHYDLHNAHQIAKIINDGHGSYQHWRRTNFSTRKASMLVMAKCLRERKEDIAKLMACEMGKPVTAGKLEVEKCAWVCEHYAEHAENYLAPRNIHTEMSKNIVCFEPLGVVFAIMPWNFPCWQVFRFAAPTLMAGNAAILKHAPISTGTGQLIVELFLEAGFPQHLFQQLIVDEEVAGSVIAHPHIVAVTLTGSERAGRAVASQAGTYLKKCVLELGGNDPYIVLEDADINLAARCIVASRLSNTGQVCIAAKRIIVMREVMKDLVDAIQALIPNYVMGDPLLPNTQLGPMARDDLRESLQLQVAASIRAGATLLLGGSIPEGPGFYYPPTILTGVSPGMPAFDEELFGPVISIISADNESHAIALANQSQYGLAGAIFTRDEAKGERIAMHEIETGACYVNAFVSSDPRVPFGGIKLSGFGRELSQEGILEFVNVKSIGVG